MSKEVAGRRVGGTRYVILHGDCVVKMQSLEEGSVDVVVCDPPYG